MMMSLLQNLPKDQSAVNALFAKKLDEHDKALKKVQAEDVIQNKHLEEIDGKLGRIEKNTQSIVEINMFTRSLCRYLRLIGKFICWFAGVAGAIAGLYELWIFYGGGS